MKTFIFVLKYLWQLPQNIIGLIYELITSAEKFEVNSDFTLYKNKLKGSVSLGDYIFIDKNSVTNNKIILHELGHRQQSLILGPLYLLIIGLPSIIWASLYSLFPSIYNKYSYYDFYTEKWANKLMGL